MKLYAETKNGFPVNTDIMCAIEGALMSGVDVLTFTASQAPIIGSKALKSDIVPVGSIDSMKQVFSSMGKMPPDLDFPKFAMETHDSQLRFLGRKVVDMTVREAFETFERTKTGFYVKPVETKLFDAMEIGETAQGYFREYMNDMCYASGKISMQSEWRAFVHHGKIVDVRGYKGDFRLFPDFNFIEDAVSRFERSMAAYTIDVAVSDGKTVIVEYGDMWAVGSYGIDPQVYFEMLRDRFKEIKGRNENV